MPIRHVPPIDSIYGPTKGASLNGLLLFDLVHDDLQKVEATMQQAASEASGPLRDAILYLVKSGGKRLRPALTIAAGRCYPVDEAKLIYLATAVEMLHTATLVHDDVIDGSLLRRGNPTLNARWNVGATVLAGDYIFAKAAVYSTLTDNPPVVRLFAHTLSIICNGELEQMFKYYDLDQSKEEYYRRIYAKTASLFAASAELGAMLGGASPLEQQAFREYGHNLGMAFQIVDDILDFVGSEEVLGKPVGSDLRQGTITLPVFYYLSEGGDPTVITRVFNERDEEAKQEALAAALHAIRTSGAIERAQEEALTFVRRAQEALQHVPDTPYRDALREISTYVVERTH
ncbi:MAG: polyprenyl synthetase family protein [Chloroflexi bacterium]|nr:polyprenyl synthetase family protein [Chloroflexota bacterium]